MDRQQSLPGISARPKAADIKALVKSRLLGFELRRLAHAQRRNRRAPVVEAQPRQQELFPASS